MGKVIVDNRSSMDDAFAVGLALDVIRGGRVSNWGKQYCYLSFFELANTGKRIGVATDLNKCSDRFIVYDDGGTNG